MFVNPMVSMGMSIGLGSIMGVEANRDIINNINRDFNEGRSVIFGNDDPTSTYFRNFCNKVLLPCREAASNVMTTMRRIVAPVVDKPYIIINDYSQYSNIPTTMMEPLIFAPYARELFLNDQINGWDIPKEYVEKEEDIWGRLIDNGTVEFIQGEKYPDYLEYHFKSTDPDYEIHELDAVDISRQYFDTFLKQELSKGGKRRDPTSIGDSIVM